MLESIKAAFADTAVMRARELIREKWKRTATLHGTRARAPTAAFATDGNSRGEAATLPRGQRPAIGAVARCRLLWEGCISFDTRDHSCTAQTRWFTFDSLMDAAYADGTSKQQLPQALHVYQGTAPALALKNILHHGQYPPDTQASAQDGEASIFIISITVITVFSALLAVQLHTQALAAGQWAGPVDMTAMQWPPQTSG
ncbi:hypothetical protein HaLaN_24940 [Haematococcus lacustris]|uniref:Uncharacterized protein n=1 Tax=Haematococcus lacustris TaxID=44745 RepID=A0A6A0A3G0_HAELA|nr:hypothetical protein HaLaN_24940 [Haematococcus lacustris]